jgi:predicted ester cyclase
VGTLQTFRRGVRATRATFPDAVFVVDDLVVEGDKAGMRWSMHGTHLGEIRTPWGTIAPTGRRIRNWGLKTYRVEHGKIVERRVAFDSLQMFEQLGALPGAGGTRWTAGWLPAEIGDRYLSAGKPATAARAEGQMSAEENKALIQHYIDEVWHAKAVHRLGDLFADEFTSHSANWGDMDLDTFRREVEATRAVFPDAAFTIDDLIAEGDRVVMRWTMRGTHQGAIETPWGTIAPTGRRVESTGIKIYRIEGGKIVQRWSAFDPIAPLMQIGAFPTLATSASEAGR